MGATAWEVASEYQSDPRAAILHIVLMSLCKIKGIKQEFQLMFCSKIQFLNTEYQSDPPAAILHVALITFYRIKGIKQETRNAIISDRC